MHKLLARQLRKQFGSTDAVPESLRPLLAAVESAYVQADEDRAMLERSMENVSIELADRFQRLRDALDEKDGVSQALSVLTATLESTADGIVVVRLGQVDAMHLRPQRAGYAADIEILARHPLHSPSFGPMLLAVSGGRQVGRIGHSKQLRAELPRRLGLTHVRHPVHPVHPQNPNKMCHRCEH